MMTSQHCTVSASVGQRLHVLLACGLEALRTWQHRCHGRHALRHLDDRLLKDIGLSRAAAVREASKPFWRP